MSVSEASHVISSLEAAVSLEASLRVPGRFDPGFDAERAEALEGVARAANRRYVVDFLEAYGFCPFARRGRLAGETDVRVHFATTGSDGTLRSYFDAASASASSVVQVVFPLLQVAADEWSRYCFAATDALNRQQPSPVFACAPLHPDLPFNARRASGLVPLFRRAPDPTLQWVRLATIESLYQGRDHRDVFVPPSKIADFLRAPPRASLYERTLDTNARVAERVSVERLVAELGELHDTTQREYARLLAPR